VDFNAHRSTGLIYPKVVCVSSAAPSLGNESRTGEASEAKICSRE
jgi:hypothetical protein